MERKADAAIVFGAYVYDSGRPCPMLEDRLIAGSRVYESGLTSKMLLSGDHGTRGYDEVNAMKEFILGAGYPKEDVFLDHAGFSTYDTVLRAIKVFEIEKAVLSTQKYHLVRAVYIARKNGMEAWGVSADLRPYPKSQMTRYVIREWLARTKDFVYVNILRPDPVFLGGKIPITGDSGPTYDE
jgi:vancomycin permeability regulator SanA